VPEPVVVVCFGDSLTEGTGLAAMNGRPLPGADLLTTGLATPARAARRGHRLLHRPRRVPLTGRP
jgi:hypothetical protein